MKSHKGNSVPQVEQGRTHYKLGGSTAKRWISCPGSVQLIDSLDVKQKPAGPAAKKGDVGHKYAEMALKQLIQHKLKGTDPNIKFELLTATPNPVFDTPEEQEKYVQWARDYRDVVFENVCENSITKKAYGFETLVTLDKKLQSGGYIDFWLVDIDHRARRRLSIVDYKTGYHEVEVQKNEQLLLYAAAFRAYLVEKGKDIDYVRLVIYQPQSEPEAFKQVTYTIKQLETFTKKALKAAAETYSDKPKLKSGSHCQWCPAQTRCPQYTKEIETQTAIKLIDTKAIKVPQVQLLPKDGVARIALDADRLHAFIDECVAYAINCHENGSPLPGTKVVETKPRRQWLKDTDRIAADLNALDIGVVVKNKPSLIPLTEVEKKLVTKFGPEQAKVFLEPHIGLTNTSKQLVPDTDSRISVETAHDLLVDESTTKERMTNGKGKTNSNGSISNQNGQGQSLLDEI